MSTKIHLLSNLSAQFSSTSQPWEASGPGGQRRLVRNETTDDRTSTVPFWGYPLVNKMEKSPYFMQNHHGLSEIIMCYGDIAT